MISTISRQLSLRGALRFQSPISSSLASTITTTQTSKTQTRRPLSTLPDHIVMGMPALSPTMEVGTISSWNVTEGQSFSAGDSLAEIETDKATIDFEAQDDGIVAKILVEAGSQEIAVGVGVVVVVEEEEDVEAFRDFVEEVVEVKEEEVVEPVVVEPEVVKEVVEPVVPVAAAVEAPVAPPPTPEPVAAVAPAVPEGGGSPPISPSWGNLARVRSPLARTLAKNQKKYIELYGSTGQIPL